MRPEALRKKWGKMLKLGGNFVGRGKRENERGKYYMK
jgi:hypothetical protein